MTTITYAAKRKWDGHHIYEKGGFKTMEEANDWLNKQIAEKKLVAPQNENREYYIIPEEPLQVKVGDIFQDTTIYYSNRTTFVKVTAISKSGKTCDVVELGKSQVDGDWMNGNVTCDGVETNNRGYKFRIIRGWDGNVAVRGRLVWDFGSSKNVRHIETYRKWNGEPIWNNCD